MRVRDRLISAPVMLITTMLIAACFGPSREKAIENAIEQVKETMEVAFPDLPHPEPYKYQDTGDCALVPGLSSSKETLRYQVELNLPPGDDGIQRQARAIQHWVDKGAVIRTLPYRTGPPSEVNYKGGSIVAFAMQRGERSKVAARPVDFFIVATTPCVPKSEG